MDDDLIDAEVQRELDAISLSDSEDDDDKEINEEQFADKLETKNTDHTDWVQLFLEKSSERNKVAQNILVEAEDILNECPSAAAPVLSLTYPVEKSGEISDELVVSNLQKSDSENPPKSAEEIEEENRVRLQELEKELEEKERYETLITEKAREKENEELLMWQNMEDKMQSNVKLMLDKADYWEKTYGEIAQEELERKEDDLQAEFLASQRNIVALQEEQRRILQDLLHEKEERENAKKDLAATCIQSWFRGSMVRRKYGTELKKRQTESREKRRQEKIAALELKRAQLKAEEDVKKRLAKEKVRAEKLVEKKEEQESKNERRETKENNRKGNEEKGKDEYVEQCQATDIAEKEMEATVNNEDEKRNMDKGMKKEMNEKLPENSPLKDKTSHTTNEDNVEKDTSTTTCENEEVLVSSVNITPELASDKTTKSGTLDHKLDTHMEAGNTGIDSDSHSVKKSVNFIENDSESQCDKKSEHISSSKTTKLAEKFSGMISETPSTPEKETTSSTVLERVDNVVNKTEKCNAKSGPNDTSGQILSPETDLHMKLTNSVGNDALSNESTLAICGSIENDKLDKRQVGISCIQMPQQICSPEKDLQMKSSESTSSVAMGNESTQAICGDIAPENKSLLEEFDKRDMTMGPEIRMNENVGGKLSHLNGEDVAPEPEEDNDKTGTTQPLVKKLSPVQSEVDVSHVGNEKMDNLGDFSDNIGCKSVDNEKILSDTTSEKSESNDNNSETKAEMNTVPEKREVTEELTTTTENKSEVPQDERKNKSDFIKTASVSATQEVPQSVAEPETCLDTFKGKTDNSRSSPSERAASQNTLVKISEPDSLANRIVEQHCRWLRDFHNRKPKNKNKVAHQRRTRKIVRVSSAAKRLLPFTEKEILSGTLGDEDLWNEVSLEDIKTLYLSGICDGKGRNLSSVSRCIHLTNISLHHCGLVSIENLQSCSSLRHLNVSHNSINMISCSGMKRLESFIACHNRLTSIHGLDGCSDLLHIDLSHNNITKISGLEDVKNLLHFRITHNQLMSLSGLCHCENLLYLDVSENHLMSLQDLEDCRVITSLKAAGNNLEDFSPEFLCNAILLMKLDVSRNSLQSLNLPSTSWLPMISELDASINRIGTATSEDVFGDFSAVAPNLIFLNLSKNLISELGLTTDTLAHCQRLEQVDLSDNPLNLTEEDHTLLGHLYSNTLSKDANEPAAHSENLLNAFCPLRKMGKVLRAELESEMQEHIFIIISQQYAKMREEVCAHLTEMKRCMIKWKAKNPENQDEKDDSCIPDMLSVHTAHLKKLRDIATYYRKVYESEDLRYETNETSSSKDMSDLLSKGKAVDCVDIYHEKRMSPTDQSSKIPTAETKYNDFVVKDCVQTPHNSESSKEPNQEEAVRKNGLSQSHQSKKRKHDITSNKSRSSTIDSLVVLEKLAQRRDAGAVEKVAAVKIQSAWRGYHVRKIHKNIKKSRAVAATKIQAVYRGHLTRSKIQRAMDSLKQSSQGLEEEDELEDVDLDDLNFDEESFNEQWAYKVMTTSEKERRSEKNVPCDQPLFQNYSKSFMQQVQQPTQEVSSGQNRTFSKPPLPPIPSRVSEHSETQLTLSDVHSSEPSTAGTHRTKRSVKQEILSNQWGIKSSSTADLMMRRARRMKGGRKKMQTAQEKLHRFQEKVSSVPHVEDHLSSRRNRLPTNKMEYFKAREMEFQTNDKISSAAEEDKRQYTYEWLHTQVGSQYDPYSKSSPSPPRKLGPSPLNTKRSNSSGLLPPIPRSPSLVATQDLEIVSMNSGSSYASRSKERLRDIARRHNPKSAGTHS